MVSNLPQAQALYYDKSFIRNLKQNTPFVMVATKHELPRNSGNTRVQFMYPLFGANTVEAPEGQVTGGITVTPLTNSQVIGEYSDFATFSSLAIATALDPVVENVGKEMAYRVGQTLSQLIRIELDGGTVIDPSVLISLGATDLSTFSRLTRASLVSAVSSLKTRGVHPQDGGLYKGVISPAAVGDMLADTTINGVIDFMKHTSQSQRDADALINPDSDGLLEFPATGVAFYQSGLVTQTANYDGGTGSVSGLTALRSYILGDEGVQAIKLAAQGDTDYGDGNYRNIRCNVVNNAALSISDPAGMIPGWTSYRVHFTAGFPPTDAFNGLRYRILDAGSAIS